MLFVLPGALAFELPFGIGKLFASTIAPTIITGHLEDGSSPVSRIAVIGAGAGGSSAAFWLSKARADRKSTRLNSSHPVSSRMPSSA